jgi:hypothetical protein
MVKHPIRLAVLGVCALAAVSSAATVFVMKKDAAHDAEAIRELDRKIAAERQRISELLALWSGLDDPARLQALVERHNDVLRLEPMSARQIVKVDGLAAAVRQKAAEEGEE